MNAGHGKSGKISVRQTKAADVLKRASATVDKNLRAPARRGRPKLAKTIEKEKAIEAGTYVKPQRGRPKLAKTIEKEKAIEAGTYVKPQRGRPKMAETKYDRKQKEKELAAAASTEKAKKDVRLAKTSQGIAKVIASVPKKGLAGGNVEGNKLSYKTGNTSVTLKLSLGNAIERKRVREGKTPTGKNYSVKSVDRIKIGETKWVPIHTSAVVSHGSNPKASLTVEKSRFGPLAGRKIVELRREGKPMKDWISSVTKKKSVYSRASMWLGSNIFGEPNHSLNASGANEATHSSKFSARKLKGGRGSSHKGGKYS